MQIQITGTEERPFEVAGLPGVRHHNWGEAIAGTEHGPGGVHPDRRPEKVHERQGEHQLSVL